MHIGLAKTIFHRSWNTYGFGKNRRCIRRSNNLFHL